MKTRHMMESRYIKSTKIWRKKVLIITYYFPPGGGVGSFRVAKFVKYLPKFGWETAVLTAQEKYYPWLDKSLDINIPSDTTVYRLPICRTGFVNDKGIRWIPYALREIKTVIKREKPAVIYITGGPFFPLTLGPTIKRCFGLPYVIDLRDPWRLAEQGNSAHKGIKQRTGKLLTDLLEPFVIRHASKVICATEPMCQDYMATYKNEPAYKFATITNGFDPEDFEHIQTMQFDKFTIVYTGKFRVLAGFRDPGAFFRAMKLLDAKRLRIHFIHVGLPEPEIVELAQTIGVSNLTSFVGIKSYAESLAYARSANLLLLIGTGQKWEQTGKIFDYISCNRPILALAPEEGAIAEVIKQIPFATLVPNPAPIEIASLIREVYQKKHIKYDASSEQEFVRRHHRDHLTQILAMTLDEVIDEKKTRR